MTGPVIKNSELKVGIRVGINPKSDRTRKEIVDGIIAEILTKADIHPHGIMVRLESGEVGRVKIINSQGESGKYANPLDQSIGNNDYQISERIELGENHFTEFKASLLWSLRLTGNQINESTSFDVKKYGRNTSKVIIAKTIAGFLNTDGGLLIIGVKENKQTHMDEVISIEPEYGKLVDKNQDGYRRMIIDGVIKAYFPTFIFNHLNNYIRILFDQIDDNVVCGIVVLKSDNKVFMKLNKEDHFYIRVDASTRLLHGEEIVDYCVKRFK